MAEFVVEFGKDGRPVEADGRLDAAAFHRNHQPIWAVLEKFLAGRSGDGKWGLSCKKTPMLCAMSASEHVVTIFSA